MYVRGNNWLFSSGQVVLDKRLKTGLCSYYFFHWLEQWTGSELMSHCRNLLECCSSCVLGSAGAHFLAQIFQSGREALNMQQILTRWRMFSPKEKAMVPKIAMAAYYGMEIQWFLTGFDFVPWFLFLAVRTQ